MSEPSKNADLSIFPVDIMDMDDADLAECYRLFFNRHLTGEPCSTEVGEFANALLVEMKNRGLAS